MLYILEKSKNYFQNKYREKGRCGIASKFVAIGISYGVYMDLHVHNYLPTYLGKVGISLTPLDVMV